jgi:hypothetical protein
VRCRGREKEGNTRPRALLITLRGGGRWRCGGRNGGWGNDGGAMVWMPARGPGTAAQTAPLTSGPHMV